MILRNLAEPSFQTSDKPRQCNQSDVPTSFDGTNNEGISQEIYKSVLEEPWYARVENYLPLEPGEHPRLLFRKSDIPALREHMKTPEGQAILTRLRYLLDGAEGNRPPAHYSSFTHA